MRWEYRTVKVAAKGWLMGGNLDEAELDQMLNELGDHGWELVSIVATSKGHGQTRDVAAVLKRPKGG